MSKYIFVKINDDITSIKRLKEMFPKIEEEDFEDILASDPTYNNNTYEAGKYGKWLLSLFNKNNLKKEDLYKAKEYLEKFDKLKNKISNKDINTYKNLPDLYKVIEETESKSPTKSELKRNVQRTDLDKDAELFMETENFKIYVPLTYEASCKLGSGTEWCTATRSNREYYDMYTSDGNDLYIVINKKDPSEKYQWNTKEEYTCDKNDEEISEDMLCIKHPDLIKFFEKLGYDNIEKIVEKVKEYVEGKEYIYDGKKIDEDIYAYLKKVRVSNSVTSIGQLAFEKCKSLESIIIPNGVTSIERGAFFGCSSLKNITIPNSVTSIGNEAFEKCRALESIEIPDSVTSIGEEAFCDCYSLTNIKIPNSVTSIGEDAFHDCRSLESIKIPNSVTKIEAYIFYNCSSLKSIEIPNSVTSIGAYAFGCCNSLENIAIPNSVTSIGKGAFYNCMSLTSIEMPSNIISIEDSIFLYCDSLKSIKIPNKVTSIEESAFWNCRALKSVIIPNSVKYISPDSFEGHSPDLVIKTKNPYAIEYCKEYDLKYSEE